MTDQEARVESLFNKTLANVENLLPDITRIVESGGPSGTESDLRVMLACTAFCGAIIVKRGIDARKLDEMQ